MSLKLPTKPGTVLNSIYLLCVISFVVAIATFHVKLITHEFPLDYYEGGMLVTTATIAEGSNPYSLDSQPSRISLYPVLYNIVVAQFSGFFGNTLELHRTISGLFILACCALCFYVCRREGVARTESVVAGALLYAGLLFYSTPIASPNGLGLFLFLAAIIIPWVDRFSTRSLCITILLGILGFYTKQYFIACLGYVALYLFLAISKKRAIYFGIAALSSFIAVLAVVLYTSPYYLDDTFFAVQSTAILAASDEQVIKQLKEFVQIYLPVLVIFAIAILHRGYAGILVSAQPDDKSQGKKLVDVFNFGKPLLLRQPNYIWVCCACSLIIFVLVLGKNRGNHLTYLFQLVSPFLLVGIFALSSKMPKWRWPFSILIVVALYKSYVILPNDFSVKEDNWETMRKEIFQADDIYASTLILKEIIAKGGPIYLSGSTRYFAFADVPAWFVKAEQEHTIPALWEAYVKLIQAKIEKQEFDLLVMDHWMSLPTAKPSLTLSLKDESDTLALLQEHYTKTSSINLPLANRPGGGNYRVHLWKPKTAKPQIEK